MPYNDELLFEKDLIKILVEDKSWSSGVIHNPTEEDLIENWRTILTNNNIDEDTLNGCPLTRSEMQQILNKIRDCKTPANVNEFINGETVSIVRDCEDDKLHFGKSVSLRMFKRDEIAGGNSVYQIAEQPIFESRKDVLPDRRGDFMLLINGMPVIHVELKRSGTNGSKVDEACYQIEKYLHEGVFSGIYGLVQVFVAMTPEETLYFANPGYIANENDVNRDFYFHWADINNEPINRWQDVAEHLLSIPMAHYLIAFYTIGDKGDGVLKVLRSYQYYAAYKIFQKVRELDWGHLSKEEKRGGYIFATTGSGKTMTSFKAAHLIASMKEADKVVFLLDRIELGQQSLKNYENFAGDLFDVSETETTYDLINKLTSKNGSDTLIVTSIQKMSRIEEDGLNASQLNEINKKRMVIIVDECHRSVFGDMLGTIKKTFINAVFFGFSGTPILDENSKHEVKTSDIFGDELTRYTISDGIRDHNVLGFDPNAVYIFDDDEIRDKVARRKAGMNSTDKLSDQSQPVKDVYNAWYNKDMISLELELPSAQYESETYQKAVVSDINKKFDTYSNGKFHALFATSSIKEAIEYYRLFKQMTELKVSCVFDKTIDNNKGNIFKEDGLVEIITDYNNRYFDGNSKFNISNYNLMKKDICNRLAHKEAYRYIEKEEDKQLDLLIVVDQMLTGYDSKWVNTLYLDKILENEHVIQAISRTNRIFDRIDKPYGIIRFYRKPYLMESNLKDAIELYSGNKAYEVYVDKLPEIIDFMNLKYASIKNIFESEGINDFSRLPKDKNAILMFASDFHAIYEKMYSAKIQDFSWEDSRLTFTKEIYDVLLARYGEIERELSGSDSNVNLPFNLVQSIHSTKLKTIDSNYLDSKFKKYLLLLNIEGTTQKEIDDALDELHRLFLTLSPEKQKVANDIIFEIKTGSLELDETKTLGDYINERLSSTRDTYINKLANSLGLNIDKLKKIMDSSRNESNMNEFGLFDDVRNTLDRDKAKKYYEDITGEKVSKFAIANKMDKLLATFILKDGFDPYDKNIVQEVTK